MPFRDTALRVKRRLASTRGLFTSRLGCAAGTAERAQRGGGAWRSPLVEFLALAITVFASVRHADVIAHRTGEPNGTLALTVAVTVIEVALILSIMLAGDGSPSLARETVFPVIMVVCNGVAGLCLSVGGFRYGGRGSVCPVRTPTSRC